MEFVRNTLFKLSCQSIAVVVVVVLVDLPNIIVDLVSTLHHRQLVRMSSMPFAMYQADSVHKMVRAKLEQENEPEGHKRCPKEDDRGAKVPIGKTIMLLL